MSLSRREIVLAGQPDDRFLEVAVLEQQQRRNAADHERARRHRVLVDVDLRDRHAAVVVLGQLIDGRRKAPARRAPLAQKSTSTTPLFTDSSKSASVNVLTFSDAMKPSACLMPVAPLPVSAELRRRFERLTRLYTLTYSAAERSHEKSARMPFFCSRVQSFWLRERRERAAEGVEQRVGSILAKTESRCPGRCSGCTGAPCRPVRRPRARPARCRSAGCTSG